MSDLTPAEVGKLIADWRDAKANADGYGKQEKEARVKLAQAFFPTPREGTQRHTFVNGYRLKLQYTLSYKLGNKDAVNESGEKIPVAKQVEAALEAIEKLGNEGPMLADMLVKVEYKLDTAAYKALDLDMPTHRQARDIIDGILTINPPGTPQLDLEEPE